MEQIEIRETEDLYLLTSRLFQAGSYREEILLEEAYKHSYPQDGYSICLRITTDGQWWEDGILKGELTRTGLETEGISVSDDRQKSGIRRESRWQERKK